MSNKLGIAVIAEKRPIAKQQIKKTLISMIRDYLKWVKNSKLVYHRSLSDFRIYLIEKHNISPTKALRYCRKDVFRKWISYLKDKIEVINMINLGLAGLKIKASAKALKEANIAVKNQKTEENRIPIMNVNLPKKANKLDYQPEIAKLREKCREEEPNRVLIINENKNLTIDDLWGVNEP